MDFKDRMIEAIENGLTTEDNAYDYVRESMADATDAAREPSAEVTIPLFMAGDRVIWLDRDNEMGEWIGTVTEAKVFEPEVFVKLDVGGTYRVPRVDLRRA